VSTLDVVTGLYEAINARDADAAAAWYAEDALNHGRPVGREGMRKTFESLLATFPDVRYQLLLATVDGDRVACRLRMTGTHLGEPTRPEMYHGMLAGVAPTGRGVDVLQMHELRLCDGLIAEHEAVRDDLGMLLQLGLVRPPG
jgi:predicted ester cyclase